MPTPEEWNDAEMDAEAVGAHYATPAEAVAALTKRIELLKQRILDTRSESEAGQLALEFAQAEARLKEYQLLIKSQN